MLIDTHVHLNFKDFDKDRDEIIKKCQKENVGIINVGVNYESSKEVIEIAEKYDGVYAAAAVHPHDVSDARDGNEFDYNRFKELAKNSKVVAIGECGLDYEFCENDPEAQKKQQEIFIQHLKLAQEVNKPVMIHSRRLFPEILEILKTHYSPTKAGVLHCYMGRWSYAEEYLKLGFYLSFTGLITYARDYDKVIRNCPLDRILIETDSPYLPPHQIFGVGGLAPEDRKKIRNTPLNVKYVAQKIAEIKGITFEEVAEQTTKNAQKLFNLL